MSEFDPLKYHHKVIAWKSSVSNALRNTISTLSSSEKGELMRSLTGYVDFNKEGDPWRVKWKFKKHGIFWFKGVGKGYTVVNGRIIRAINRGNATYIIDKTIQRSPVDWFNEAINSRIPALADIITDYYADKTMNVGMPDLKIKGINQTIKR